MPVLGISNAPGAQPTCNQQWALFSGAGQAHQLFRSLCPSQRHRRWEVSKVSWGSEQEAEVDKKVQTEL